MFLCFSCISSTGSDAPNGAMGAAAVDACQVAFFNAELRFGAYALEFQPEEDQLRDDPLKSPIDLLLRVSEQALVKDGESLGMSASSK